MPTSTSLEDLLDDLAISDSSGNKHRFCFRCLLPELTTNIFHIHISAKFQFQYHTQKYERHFGFTFHITFVVRYNRCSPVLGIICWSWRAIHLLVQPLVYCCWSVSIEQRSICCLFVHYCQSFHTFKKRPKIISVQTVLLTIALWLC